MQSEYSVAAVEYCCSIAAVQGTEASAAEAAEPPTTKSPPMRMVRCECAREN